MKKHHKLLKKESYKNSEPTEKQLKTIANQFKIVKSYYKKVTKSHNTLADIEKLV